MYNCDGRAIMINVIVNHCKLCIVNIYAPTEKKNREQFFNKIASWIQENMQLQYELIIGGDFNSVFCTQNDVKGNKNNYQNTPVNLKCLVKQFDLCDIWRKINPAKKQFTWRNLLLNVASRLDYWLIHNNLRSKVIVTDIRPAVRCDHNAIFIKLRLGDIKKGPGYWKFNNKVLKDEYYKRQIKNIVGNIEKQNVSFCEKWEMVKIKCREFTQRFCAKNKNKDDLLRKDLEKKIGIIQNKVDGVDVIDEQMKKEYIRVKHELEDLYEKDCKGASIRARVKWIEEGEKNTKYFMGLERKNGEKKNIIRLRKDNSLIIKQNEILKEVVSFYEQLYASKKVNLNDVEEYLKDSRVNKLSKVDKNNFEGLITLEECRKVIFQMTKNKAPGGDGLTIEFYQEFWNDIEYIFVNALNANFDNNVMSETQKQGIITLIYKKGETANLNNWRPITLLNYDYKIMAAVLANRMQKVISSIIHENQVGYKE